MTKITLGLSTHIVELDCTALYAPSQLRNNIRLWEISLKSAFVIIKYFAGLDVHNHEEVMYSKEYFIATPIPFMYKYTSCILQSAAISSDVYSRIKIIKVPCIDSTPDVAVVESRLQMD